MQHLGCSSLLMVILATLAVGCRKDTSGSDSQTNQVVSQDQLREVEGLPLAFQSSICVEDNSDPTCESWIGMRGDVIGLVHYSSRNDFTIENVTDDARFRLAVFPDCTLEQRVDEYKAANAVEAHPDAGKPFPDDIGAKVGAPGPEGVLPPADDETIELPAVEEQNSPLAECKRFVAPAPATGQPVRLLTQDEVGELGWWRLLDDGDGTPSFQSASPCEDDRCETRLRLSPDGLVTSVTPADEGYALKSLWGKITGAVVDNFKKIETSIEEAAKSVGKVEKVSKLGGKKLYVEASKPATRLYSAVAEQGPEALKLADGVVKEGAVYAQVGAQYATIAGQAVLTGATYIGEYLLSNLCVMGITVGLSSAVAGQASLYEAPLSLLAQTFAEEIANDLLFQALFEDKGSPLYQGINAAATAIAAPTSLVSKRFTVDQWRVIILDIIAAALTGDVKAGFTGIIISKIAEVICNGLDHPPSPANAFEGTQDAYGLQGGCIEIIRPKTMARYEAGEDLCYALRDEIAKAAAEASAPKKKGPQSVISTIARQCPKSVDHEGYGNWLEGVGCAKPRVLVSKNRNVGETDIPDSLWLVNNRYWARTGDWFAGVSCPADHAAVGMCSSGGNPDCYGVAKELLCAKRPTGSLIKAGTRHYLRKGFDAATAMCPKGHVVTSFCSSSGNATCDGTNLTLTCSPIVDELEIDYSNCEMKVSTAWQKSRLQATEGNHAMVGLCTSGKNRDCGATRSFSKTAVFCSVIPQGTKVTGEGATHTVFGFSNGANQILTTDISLNPPGYVIEGVRFTLYSEAATGRKPLKQCVTRDTGKYFVTAFPNCEGNPFHSILGYMPNTGGGSEIWRCNPSGTPLATTDYSECATKDPLKMEMVVGREP